MGKPESQLQKLVEQPEIAAPYKSAESRIGLTVFLSTLPFWGIWSCYVACWLLRAVIQGGLFSYWDLFLLSLLFIGLFGVGVTGILACVDDKLKFSSEGITFPFRFILQQWHGLNKPWLDLKSVEFLRNHKASLEPNVISFQFKSCASVPLFINGLTEKDLRQLILTLDAYAPHVEYMPSRSSVQLNMPSLTGAKSQTFTQLWEDDLNSRFTSTAFVPLEPGSTLQSGALVIIGQIAFGGLSAIYLARRPDGARVVVKEAVIPLNADEQSRTKALEMFHREAQFLIALNHPRIAKVFDHFLENGRHYLLLEHIEGTDLRRFVRESGPQPETFVIGWTEQVTAILDFLHTQSPPIVHRDVTPDNLVLANDGNITLIDFGAANEFVGTATGTLIGKQSYISPEQFRGKAQTASDIYSLGCTMYFLLTGEDPEPLSASHPKLKNATISQALNDLIAECTDEEVSSRVKDAATLAKSLRHLTMTSGGVHRE